MAERERRAGHRRNALEERLFLMHVSPGIRGSDCDWSGVFREMLRA